VNRLAIAICMFERLSVRDTLRSLATLERPAGLAIEVIVADNNLLPLSREAVEQEARALGLVLRYVHAPARNIAVARNACLDAADGDWLAFIDDDEEVAPGWLVAAWNAAQGGADAVFGPVQARYGADAPGWMVAGDFHSTGIGPRDPIDKGYSGNALLRLVPLRDSALRFDPRLGRIGGEDSDFFRKLYRTGARFAYVPAALAHEPVPLERATLGWLCRRRFRTGQIHVLIAENGRAGRVRIGLAALAKCGWSALAALATLPSRRHFALHLQRALFHAGVVDGAIGHAPLSGYG